ncbi:AbfB domain-containing protein [Paenibacillus sp. BR1-192]|uniref:AbfB domain-containing protein n=1 Tax=Paenibacillus sp. BR1-192 TaxID=3032287 RepID=UPI00240DD838|nr:AbfB domain-containing protein [Paenibacillus sp. BR1-192]WFB57136.1 AbfB domain-containing protein [Paenibacillus sp. BR1-192]
MNTRLKRFGLLAVIVMLFMSTLAAPTAQAAAIGTVVYSNPAEPEPYYVRAVKLDNGDILTTFTPRFPGNAGWSGMQPFPFYKSTDNGATWSLFSEIDPNDYGLNRNQQGMTTLYVLPQQVGDNPAGTLLFASTDWDNSAPYTIHIWRSTDNGATWQFHSNLAARGTEGTKRTWEPEFAITADGRLICYYSDERKPGYNQAIAQEISSDGGLTWGNYSIIVGNQADWNWRPGMPRVIQAKNGSYFMFFEMLGAAPNFAVRFKTSPDGINWGSPTDLGEVVGTGIYRASQTPEVAYIDDGTANGRFYVRGMTDVVSSANKMFTSADYGATWTQMDAPLTVKGTNQSTPAAWSGTLLPLGPSLLLEVNTVKVGSRNEIRANAAQVDKEFSLVSGGTYKLVNQNNQLLLDNAGGGSPAGTNVIQWNDLGADTQWWRLDYRNGGFFRAMNVNNSLILDNPNGATTPGTNVIMWTNNELDTQRWKFTHKGNGYYTSMNERSGLMLDNAGAGAPAGTKVIQWTANGLDTQNWKAVRVDAEIPVNQFESFNIANSFVRYHDGRGKIDGGQYSGESQWRMVPGLADPSAVSIESVSFPGQYLRHRDGKIWLESNNESSLFKQDATWKLRTGFSSPWAASFESYNISGTYIRHRDGMLEISPITTELDQKDATFYVK